MRPIDLQDNFSKAPLAAREQHVQQTRPEQAQYQLTRQQVKEQTLNENRVVAGEKTQPSQITKDKEKEGQKQRSETNQKARHDQSVETSESSMRRQDGKGEILDIVV